MQSITTSVSSFENLIRGGFVYVDKTAQVLELLKPAFAQYFLARPRRFGKSLLVSTLQAIFEGKRELFKGLAIESRWDWSRVWPVIRLDLGSIDAKTPEEFRLSVRSLLDSEASRLGVSALTDVLPADAFRQLIERVAATAQDGKCVVLVDEYDKPLLRHLARPEAALMRDELKPFFGVVKYTEALQRFALLTGVSKFSKVSIFSDLNNLTDLTLSPVAATLLGYTHEELRTNFMGRISALAQQFAIDEEAAFARLARWYDGYRFHHEAEPVFNPVSVGRCLADLEFANYWFETGTPTFLLDLLKERPISLDNLEMEASAFSTYEPAAPDVLPLLQQTGYLTIKGARDEGETRIYRLGFPNLEVGKSFSNSLASAYSSLPESESAEILAQMVTALRKEDVDGLLDALSLFFAHIPANIMLKNEKYYQSLFYAVFTLLGARIQAECWTNRGRIDAVVSTDAADFIFEFKLDDTAEVALRQIHERGYAERFSHPNRRVHLIGVAFDSAARNLSDRRHELLNQTIANQTIKQ